jgi:hypothetical protein
MAALSQLAGCWWRSGPVKAYDSTRAPTSLDTAARPKQGTLILHGCL